MAAPAALVSFLEPWSELYSNSGIVATVVVFGHIAALVFAGGLAVTLDRATMRAARGSAESRAAQLGELAAAHRLVVGGLALSAVTGVLLFAADVETFFVSWVFWSKLALIVLLLANGYLMTRAEGRIARASGAVDESNWRALRRAAAVSMVLWFAIAFAGVALVNAG